MQADFLLSEVSHCSKIKNIAKKHNLNSAILWVRRPTAQFFALIANLEACLEPQLKNVELLATMGDGQVILFYEVLRGVVCAGKAPIRM